MSLIIEQFTPKYQEAVQDFIFNIWKEFGFTYIPDEDADLDDIESHYSNKRGAFYILRDSDNILGTIGILARSKNIAELVRLYVDKTQQNKGFGSQLVDQAITFCKKSGFKK